MCGSFRSKNGIGWWLFFCKDHPYLIWVNMPLVFLFGLHTCETWTKDSAAGTSFAGACDAADSAQHHWLCRFLCAGVVGFFVGGPAILAGSDQLMARMAHQMWLAIYKAARRSSVRWCFGPHSFWSWKCWSFSFFEKPPPRDSPIGPPEKDWLAPTQHCNCFFDTPLSRCACIYIYSYHLDCEVTSNLEVITPHHPKPFACFRRATQTIESPPPVIAQSMLAALSVKNMT